MPLTTSVDPQVMPVPSPLTLPPPALPLPLFLCSMVHGDSGGMCDLVARHIASKHSSMSVVGRMSAMVKVHEGLSALVIAGAVANVVDNHRPASALMVTAFLQDVASSKDGEYAGPG